MCVVIEGTLKCGYGYVLRFLLHWASYFQWLYPNSYLYEQTMCELLSYPSLLPHTYNEDSWNVNLHVLNARADLGCPYILLYTYT